MSSKPVPRSRSRLTLLLGLLAAIVVIAAVGLLPRLGQMQGGGDLIGAPFTLTDQHGKTVSSADFRGRTLLIYFGYTFCPDACPTALSNISLALDQMPPSAREKIVPFFITIDPERDTVPQMSSYLANFSPAIIGLTGTPDQIAPVVKAFRVYAHKVPGEGGAYTMDHSSILYLIDGEGRFAGTLAPTATPKEIAESLLKRVG